MRGTCRDGSEKRCPGAGVSSKAELVRDTNCWRSTAKKRREYLHRPQLTTNIRFALRLRIRGPLLIPNKVQPRLKPCAARPAPVVLRQARLVVIALIDGTLAEDCFPSIHDRAPFRYSYLLYDALEKGFFKGCLGEHSKA